MEAYTEIDARLGKEVCRWVGTKGDVYVFGSRKILLHRPTLLNGDFVVVLKGDFKKAEAYVNAQGGKYLRKGNHSVEKPLKVISEIIPKKPRGNFAHLTKEQRIEVNRRVKFHAYRVAQELYLRDEVCGVTRDFKQMRERWIDFLKYWIWQSKVKVPTLEIIAELCKQKPSTLSRALYRYLIKPEEVGLSSLYLGG
jgi:hypothetical protein